MRKLQKWIKVEWISDIGPYTYYLRVDLIEQVIQAPSGEITILYAGEELPVTAKSIAEVMSKIYSDEYYLNQLYMIAVEAPDLRGSDYNEVIDAIKTIRKHFKKWV